MSNTRRIRRGVPPDALAAIWAEARHQLAAREVANMLSRVGRVDLAAAVDQWEAARHQAAQQAINTGHTP